MADSTKAPYDDADGPTDHVPMTPSELGDIKKKLEVDFGQTPAVNDGKPSIAPGQEQMKVYLRIRPFLHEELEQNEDQQCINQDTETTLTVHAPKDSVTYKNTTHGCGKQTHHFTFSKIFNESTIQRAFFEETMLSTVKDFVDGQNSLMFTYGVTGSGKTYTILGRPSDSGILPRSLDVVFNSIQGKQWQSMSLKPKMFCDVTALNETQMIVEQQIKDKVFRLSTDDEPDMTAMMGDEASDMSRATNTTAQSLPSLNSLSQSRDSSADCSTGVDSTQVQFEKMLEATVTRDREVAAIDVGFQGQIKFSIWVSFAEIYNEHIYDLLEPIPKKKTSRRTVLKLAQDKKGAPYIKGLKWIHVTTADEAYKILTIGQKNLQVACTKLNQNSSRSHCIFTMKLLRVVDKEDPHVARVSMLSFCDLAGSERYGKTQNTGERLREAGSINRSLLTLGQCIENLRYNQTHKTNPRIVPFRESKLTRLFQNFFSGKGRASMVVNINQKASMFDETLHVLRFSAIAKQVTSIQKVVEEKKRPKKLMSLSMGSDGRASVAWATPGSIKRWIEEEEEEGRFSIQDTIAEGDEDEDYEDGNEEDGEKEMLRALVKQLQEKLKEEKIRQVKIELDVREEVCNEMAEQLVKIERDYTDRMEEQRYQAEERADARIKLYMNSVKKQSRKRARVDRFEDDNDEYVSSVLLHAEKVKVQELEKEKNSLQSLLTKAQFELSAAKQELEKGVKLDKLAQETDSEMTHSELVEDLARQIEENKEKISEQTHEISQLNEMLTEAGEVFEVKEIEIEKLKATIFDLERRLEAQDEAMEEMKRLLIESKQVADEYDLKFRDQEETIARLQKELDHSVTTVPVVMHAAPGVRKERRSTASDIASQENDEDGLFVIPPTPEKELEVRGVEPEIKEEDCVDGRLNSSYAVAASSPECSLDELVPATPERHHPTAGQARKSSYAEAASPPRQDIDDLVPATPEHKLTADAARNTPWQLRSKAKKGWPKPMEKIKNVLRSPFHSPSSPKDPKPTKASLLRLQNSPSQPRKLSNPKRKSPEPESKLTRMKRISKKFSLLNRRRSKGVRQQGALKARQALVMDDAPVQKSYNTRARNPKV